MKRPLLVFVLTAAFLGLLAAPAFAADPYQGWPVTWMEDTAYVHPWGDPAYWEEAYYDPRQNEWTMTAWDTDTTPGPWWPPAKEGGAWIPFKYKAIPRSYDVWFVLGIFGAGPQGQYEALVGGFELDGYLKDADGETVWSTTVQEAREFWSIFQMPGWTYPSTNKGEETVWWITWTYHQGPLDPGLYAGRGNYLIKHQMTALALGDDSQRGPIHIRWKGATSTFPDFTLTVK